MSEEIVIFDIDGTLADVSERMHHIKRKPKNWNAFTAGMAQDKAIHSMVRLCNVLYAAGIRIVLCSGRYEKNRPETVEWLDKANILFVVEDRSRVVEMWRLEGLVCLQCAPGEF